VGGVHQQIHFENTFHQPDLQKTKNHKKDQTTKNQKTSKHHKKLENTQNKKQKAKTTTIKYKKLKQLKIL